MKKSFKYILPAVAALVLVSSGARAADGGSDVLPASELRPGLAVAQTDSLAATFGAMFGTSINGVLLDLVQRGIAIDRTSLADYLSRYLKGEPYPLTQQQVEQYYDNFRRSLYESKVTFSPESQQQALAEAAARPGAETLPSGVVIETITRGDGAISAPTDTVALRYVGTLSDGTVFDEIAETDAPEKFRVNELTPGFAEALTRLPLGGKYRITIPASGAYGDEGIPGVIPPGATLIFTVELLK